jgi:hypothetical protein
VDCNLRGGQGGRCFPRNSRTLPHMSGASTKWVGKGVGSRCRTDGFFGSSDGIEVLGHPGCDFRTGLRLRPIRPATRLTPRSPSG